MADRERGITPVLIFGEGDKILGGAMATDAGPEGDAQALEVAGALVDMTGEQFVMYDEMGQETGQAWPAPRGVQKAVTGASMSMNSLGKRYEEIFGHTDFRGNTGKLDA